MLDKALCSFQELVLFIIWNKLRRWDVSWRVFEKILPSKHKEITDKSLEKQRLK